MHRSAHDRAEAVDRVVPRPPPELWGGIECTVNRVGDRYRDQTRLGGHHDRPGDLDLFAGLGLRALRYPVLWERTAPDRSGAPDWTWPDARLGRLRALGIRPILGLVHHGSGPRHTHLLDDGFAPGLGAYAGLVAARYPWIEEWTPVNEPLTTARFSCLYGHWYPHRRDERSFWLALLNQVDATRASMRAIRAVNPAARLIQADDLGRTYATPPLAAQAAFDNERRWAGWDLLFGRVTPHHPLFAPLVRLGLGDRARRIAEDPCPPDVIGLNHYLTSDRFLDHRLDRYPAHLHGGNGRVAYADTEAVRVLDPPAAGLGGALREAWSRYATPLALTEVHNGATREEQMRWAADAWDTAAALCGQGVDVRAVTAWSLLGSHGWNTLLTGDGLYETGVFDVSSGTPRPTALATLWRALPLAGERHPVAREKGWWRRPDRLLYPPHPSGEPAERAPATVVAARSLLIRNGGGTLGDAVARACAGRGIRYVHEGGAGPLLPPASACAPWGVIHCIDAGGTNGAPRVPPAQRATVTSAGGEEDFPPSIVLDVRDMPATAVGALAAIVEPAIDRLLDDAGGDHPAAIGSSTEVAAAIHIRRAGQARGSQRLASGRSPLGVMDLTRERIGRRMINDIARLPGLRDGLRELLPCGDGGAIAGIAGIEAHGTDADPLRAYRRSSGGPDDPDADMLLAEIKRRGSDR